jgi:hypothetical protein
MARASPLQAAPLERETSPRKFAKARGKDNSLQEIQEWINQVFPWVALRLIGILQKSFQRSSFEGEPSLPASLLSHNSAMKMVRALRSPVVDVKQLLMPPGRTCNELP